MTDKTCNERIDAAMKARLRDLDQLLKGENTEELGALDHYPLGFDYIAPGTFDNQREAFFRFQLSWGGPSEEFRFFVNPDLSCHRIEYWFLDWFDGASRISTGNDERILLLLWNYLCTSGAAAVAFRATHSLH